MPENSPKQGRGCLFYGCLTTILVFVGVVVGIYFGVRTAVRTGIAAYTATAPAAVPQLEITATEQERIGRDVERRAASAARAGEAFGLNEQELNVMLRQAKGFQPYDTQIYVKPTGTQLQAEVSLPLDQFPLWKQVLSRLRAKDLQGRYFNGVAVLEPAVTNGALSLVVKDLQVNGKSLPADFTGRLKDLNLAGQAETNAQAQAILSRIEAVEVRDGKLIVKPAPPAR